MSTNGRIDRWLRAHAASVLAHIGFTMVWLSLPAIPLCSLFAPDAVGGMITMLVIGVLLGPVLELALDAGNEEKLDED